LLADGRRRGAINCFSAGGKGELLIDAFDARTPRPIAMTDVSDYSDADLFGIVASNNQTWHFGVPPH
jgi:hypothetical protein